MYLKKGGKSKRVDGAQKLILTPSLSFSWKEREDSPSPSMASPPLSVLVREREIG